MSFFFDFSHKNESQSKNKISQMTKLTKLTYETIRRSLLKIPYAQLYYYSTFTYVSYNVISNFSIFLKGFFPNLFVVKKLNFTYPTWIFGFFYPRNFNQKTDVSEACLILNVINKEDKREIMGKYRKLIVRNHPDSGGSSYLASKIIEAKETLIKNISKSNI